MGMATLRLAVLLALALRLGSAESNLLVLSKGEHTIAIVDPATGKILGKAPVDEDPHEVVASPDGKFAYVSNYGGGAYNTITVIDLTVPKRVAPIDLGPLRGPHGLVFSGGKVWFTAEAAKVIGSYDPARHAIDWVFGTGQDRTHMIFVTDDQKRMYTTNVSSATVSIIEKNPPRVLGASPIGVRRPMGPPGGDWTQTVVPVGPGAEGFDVSPDGKELWTANAQDGSVSIIDLAAKKSTQTLQAGMTGANRLKFTPDGKLVLISSLRGAGLAILDAATRKEIKRIPIERGAAGIQMQPDGARAYIACTGEGYVAVLDLKTLEFTARINAGPQPDGLAWAARP
jgi:DNA-binding beta-propeller fold protein YncE